MKKIIRQRTEISIETHEIKIIRIRNSASQIFCEQCQSQTSPFTADQIAVLLQISVDEVCRDIETGKFHLTGSPPQQNLALICGDSLSR